MDGKFWSCWEFSLKKRLCCGHRFCSNKSKLLSDICQIPSSDSWPDPLVGGFFKFECRICLLFQDDFSNLFIGFVSCFKGIFQVCLWIFTAVEQYCSVLRGKVGEFCIILSHLPSLLQTLSNFYLVPQILTRLAFFMLWGIQWHHFADLLESFRSNFDPHEAHRALPTAVIWSDEL